MLSRTLFDFPCFFVFFYSANFMTRSGNFFENCSQFIPTPMIHSRNALFLIDFQKTLDYLSAKNVPKMIYFLGFFAKTTWELESTPLLFSTSWQYITALITEATIWGLIVSYRVVELWGSGPKLSDNKSRNFFLVGWASFCTEHVYVVQ